MPRLFRYFLPVLEHPPLVENMGAAGAAAAGEACEAAAAQGLTRAAPDVSLWMEAVP